jgi:hypothetical protein
MVADARIRGTLLVGKNEKRVLLLEKRFLHYLAERGKDSSQ